jgi:hypothetical protein
MKVIVTTRFTIFSTKKSVATIKNWNQTTVDEGYPVGCLACSRKMSENWEKSVFGKL